jgi:hypothetical protein
MNALPNAHACAWREAHTNLRRAIIYLAHLRHITWGQSGALYFAPSAWNACLSLLSIGPVPYNTYFLKV